MNQAEYDELQKTFPWTEQIIQTGVGGIIRVLDRNGREVSLFAMTAFLEMITRKLAAKSPEQEAV